MFDSHCHPTDLEDAESLVEACVAQGIGLLACGYHRDSCLAVLGLRRRFPSLPVALGVHPWHCAEGWEEILAMIRRDGFASMDADAKGGTLTTRPVTFTGKGLFVNVACPQGELRAELLDTEGKVIEPYTFSACTPVSADKTLQRITWDGASDLSALAGRPVRFRFRLKSGSLYAFWVSPSATGVSRGYLAAGSLGHSRIVDTP